MISLKRLLLLILTLTPLALHAEYEFVKRAYLIDGVKQEIYIAKDKSPPYSETPVSAHLISSNDILRENFKIFMYSEFKKDKGQKESLYSEIDSKESFLDLMTARIPLSGYVSPKNFFFIDALKNYISESQRFNAEPYNYCLKNIDLKLPPPPPIELKSINEIGYKPFACGPDYLDMKEVFSTDRIKAFNEWLESDNKQRRNPKFTFLTLMPIAVALDDDNLGRGNISESAKTHTLVAEVVAQKDSPASLIMNAKACTSGLCQQLEIIHDKVETLAKEKYVELKDALETEKRNNQEFIKIASKLDDKQAVYAIQKNLIKIEELKSALKEDRMPDPMKAAHFSDEEMKDFKRSSERLASNFKQNSSTPRSITDASPTTKAKKSTGDASSIVSKMKNDNSRVADEISSLRAALDDTKSELKDVQKNANYQASPTNAVTEDRSNNVAKEATKVVTTTQPSDSKKEETQKVASGSNSKSTTSNQMPSRSPASQGFTQSSQGAGRPSPEAFKTALAKAKLDPELKELFAKTEGVEYLGELDKYLTIENGVLYMNPAFFSERDRFEIEGVWLKLILTMQNNPIRVISFTGEIPMQPLTIKKVKGAKIVMKKGNPIPDILAPYKKYFYEE